MSVVVILVVSGYCAILICIIAALCRGHYTKVKRSEQSENHSLHTSTNIQGVWQVPITETRRNSCPSGHDITWQDVTNSFSAPAHYELSAPPDYNTAIRQYMISTDETNRSYESRLSENNSEFRHSWTKEKRTDRLHKTSHIQAAKQAVESFKQEKIRPKEHF